jgi:hypothetical protein
MSAVRAYAKEKEFVQSRRSDVLGGAVTMATSIPVLVACIDKGNAATRVLTQMATLPVGIVPELLTLIFIAKPAIISFHHADFLHNITAKTAFGCLGKVGREEPPQQAHRRILSIRSKVNRKSKEVSLG